MKVYSFLLLTVMLTSIIGCNRFKANHPQANLTDENMTTGLTAASIIHYTDSVDKNLLQFTKTESLVYMLGDLSFYVEQYGNALFVERAYNGAESNSLKKYSIHESPASGHWSRGFLYYEEL